MKNLKIISYAISCCAFLFTNLVMADSSYSGFYVGLQAGYSDAHYQDVTLLVGSQPSSVDSTGLAPLLMTGYDFDRYAAAEWGVLYMAKPILYGVGYDNGSTEFKNNLVYVAGKFSLPITMAWDLYAKLGLGYIVRDDFIVNGQTALYGGEFVRPVYGLGMTYHVTTHWSLEASWMQVPQNLSIQLPESDFFGIGFSYRF